MEVETNELLYVLPNQAFESIQFKQENNINII